MSARDPNALWDRCWHVPKPADYTPGLYRMHQFTAHDLLRSGCPLSEWEAELLQIIAYQVKPLGPAQRYWLERIERERLVEIVA